MVTPPGRHPIFYYAETCCHHRHRYVWPSPTYYMTDMVWPSHTYTDMTDMVWPSDIHDRHGVAIPYIHDRHGVAIHIHDRRVAIHYIHGVAIPYIHDRHT